MNSVFFLLTCFDFLSASLLGLVYVLLTDTHALIDFVGTMDAAGLLAGGEYAIISVEEDEIYNPRVEYQYMMKGKTNDRSLRISKYH